MAFLWDEVERSPKAVQAAFFKENLQRENIRSFSEIRKGDHLLYKMSFDESYYHHCLCIDHNEEGNPMVIHYFGTPSRAVRRLLPSSAASGKNLGVTGQIERTLLPNNESLKDEADLEKKDAHRLVWPPEMRRYSVDETIDRAVRREGESLYDIVTNNCEHFVMWCMCDINTSLQVKDSFYAVREGLLALKNGGLHMLKTQLPKIAVEGISSTIDDAAIAAGKFATKGVSGARFAVGLCAGIGALVETMVAGYEIRQAYKKWDEGVLIKTRDDFVQNVSEIVTAGVCRFGFGLGGAVIGQICIPVPVLGALIGSFVGAALGNVIGNVIGPYVGKGILWIAEKMRNIFG